MNVLEALESSIQGAVGQAGAAVVGLGRGWGVGSGVVIADGRVLTNAHNLRHDETSVTFADGRRAAATVAGTDHDIDLAVLSVDTTGVTPIEWPETDEETPIGRAVLALANPGGRGLRVTPGFVSSSARSFRGPRGRRIHGALEHTAPLPRGSSGGPLTDLQGRLLGINTLRIDGGLILATPAGGPLRERIQALGRGEAPKRAKLGVAIAPPRVARRMRRAVGLPERTGVLVRDVERDSAADRAGIERGDLLVAAAGKELDAVEVLYEALDGAQAGGELELTIVRGSDERSVTVKL
jgi:serine protease Do